MIIPLWIRAAMAAAIVAVLAGFGWFVYDSIYDRGYDAAMAKWAESSAKANAAARAKEQALYKQLNEARDEATKRETILRRDADASRAAAGGLRDQLAVIRSKLPSLAAEAVRQYADTLADVFGSCTAEYREVAEAADRHSSDTKTLDDAWPK